MTTVIPLLPQAYSERLQRRDNSSLGHIWGILDAVKDPEIPVISIWDLGVLTDVKKNTDGIEVIITPTYSGCPAMDVIRSDIDAALHAAGVENFSIKTRLSPAWSTAMMSPEGKARLKDYGIAPPQENCCAGDKIACPHCNSSNTRNISEFGSTACKSLYQCNDCSEAFDYFKNI